MISGGMDKPQTPAAPEAGAPSLAGAAWLVRRETQTVLEALEAEGHQARVVGGAVRNALMGVAVKDVDVATTARPQDVIAACRKAGMRLVPTGMAHGTITVVVDAMPFEVTTLRRDVATDGRRATIAYTECWREDAERRDFTINALYCDRHGAVHDPLGGIDDIAARVIRFIGDADTRIREDYLRILRLFRLHAEYSAGSVAPEALAACVRGREGLARLSAERVRAELVRLLVAPQAVSAIESMMDGGLLPGLLGTAVWPRRFASAVAAITRLGRPPDAMLYLSALAVGVEEDVSRLADRLRLSNEERESLMVIDCRMGRWVESLQGAGLRTALYRHGASDVRRLLAAALAAGAIGADVAQALHGSDLEGSAPRFAFKGADVLAVGIAPGRQVGEILRRLEAWWIERGFPDEQELRRELSRLSRRERPEA